ncbi:sugar ABC transporter permease [Falsarthrobacter nasiphocae]|uniref:Multiple sugar transport system permease protein n=1 Tax=Falsarthrobacter nasiphocae TaxID=189863 RepID=A0AAE4C5L4_9MICC|nr:sugar ABC transporter permease [Falsarthrobacter nasiphocae]MDR6892446.1 multiple sugar transport system permease protein [Falsarthrobacter nasiphocae]
MSSTAASGATRLEPQAQKKSAAPWAALLLAPTVLLLLVVIVYPLISAVQMSFVKDSGLDPATGMFVEGGPAGFSNYTNWILQQCGGAACAPGSLGASFWSSFGNTFFYAAVTVVLETVFGFWMAIIMARTFKGRGILRAAVLVPWAIPTAVTAKLWYFMFDYNGVINTILPGNPILWLGSETSAKWAIIIADAWKTTPFMALLIVAGLQMIPGDVYEAARMDGASTWQRFRHITLPLVKPALMVAILFRTLDALRMYDLPAILTGGSNNTSTLSMLVVDQIRQGFNSASALSTITFLVIFGVAFIFIRFLGANVTEGSGPRKARRRPRPAETTTKESRA